jgi:hypothetical protein
MNNGIVIFGLDIFCPLLKQFKTYEELTDFDKIS